MIVEQSWSSRPNGAIFSQRWHPRQPQLRLGTSGRRQTPYHQHSFLKIQDPQVLKSPCFFSLVNLIWRIWGLPPWFRTPPCNQHINSHQSGFHNHHWFQDIPGLQQFSRALDFFEALHRHGSSGLCWGRLWLRRWGDPVAVVRTFRSTLEECTKEMPRHLYEWLPNLVMTFTVRHGFFDGPNRNRWFTKLKNGGSFHGELLVITRCYLLCPPIWRLQGLATVTHVVPFLPHWKHEPRNPSKSQTAGHVE